MTLLYCDGRFLDHVTGTHPERAERLRAIVGRLETSGLAGQCRRPTWEPASSKHLTLVHTLDYVDQVARFAAVGGGHIEADTVVSPGSFDTARLAVGAVCDAVARVVGGEQTTAVCLVRPPGHHALEGAAMGFCLFNNVAIAARLATQSLGLDRVLIVDWDVHHGNGTQAAFWEDERVGFLSIHRWPFYPGTGSRDETGAGPGLGATRNVPIRYGTSRDKYLKDFVEGLESLASKMKPELILVSAGYDAHRNDPVGGLGLEIEDFGALTAAVLDAADEHAGGRVVSTLEGGYDPAVLARCVEAHVREMFRRGGAET